MSAWPLAKISQLTTKVGSGATPLGGESAYKPTGIPLIRSMNVHFDGFKRDGLAFLDDQQAKDLDNAIVRADDVLLNITGASIGRVTWAPADLDGARVNQHVCIIRPRDGLEPKFLAHFLASPPQQRRIMNEQVGATRQGLTKGRILEFDVPVPPLPEQRRIVAKIEELFSDLDAGVAALERVRANLKRYRAAVLKAAVEGRLTEEWRTRHPATEPAAKLLERILAERRAKWEQDQLRKVNEAGKTPPKGWKEKYEQPTLPATEHLPALPRDWQWSTVDQLITYLRNGWSLKPNPQPPGHRLLRISAVRARSVDLSEVRFVPRELDEVADYFIEDGDLLFTRYNGSVDLLGVCGLVHGCSEPTLHPDKLIRVKTVLGQPLNAYLEIASNVGESRRHMKSRARTTAGQTGISGPDVRDMPIPLPPLAEQAEIVAEVDRRLSVAEAAETQVEHALQRAARLRQAILKRAFEGKLISQEVVESTEQVASVSIVPNEYLFASGPDLAPMTALAAMFVSELGDSPRCGRIKLVKFLFMTQAHLGIELGFRWQRQAAGPLDTVIYQLENYAEGTRSFSVNTRKGGGVQYVAGPSLAKDLDEARRVLGKQFGNARQLIEKFRPLDKDGAELLVTVYAAWNDLLIDRRPADDAAIVAEVRGWHETKMRFRPSQIASWIRWLRINSMIPHGTGIRTRPLDVEVNPTPIRRRSRGGAKVRSISSREPFPLL